MDRKDSVELVAAFAVGAILGVGATLLLRPRAGRRQRLVRYLGRTGERLGRAGRGAGAAGEALAHAGRDALRQFRDEVAEVVAAAREQLAEDAYEQLRGVRRPARRGHRRRARGR